MNPVEWILLIFVMLSPTAAALLGYSIGYSDAKNKQGKRPC